MLGPLNKHQLKENIIKWLNEDMPYGDMTTQNIIPIENTTSAQLICKEDGVICGLEIFAEVFASIDKSVSFDTHIVDGDKVENGQLIGTMSGPLSSILMGERLALNLIQRLSGIATASRDYSVLIEDLPTRIVDTRKTTPGLRQLEKYAVRIGGCTNHRYSLSDAVMLKDNHIKAVGNITDAINQVRSSIPHTIMIEVEVENIDGFKEALEAGADIIMLDNMSNTLMAEAVKINQDFTKHSAILEASGNMTLDRIRGVAETGVDVISVGALTHSVKALDISLKFK